MRCDGRCDPIRSTVSPGSCQRQPHAPRPHETSNNKMDKLCQRSTAGPSPSGPHARGTAVCHVLHRLDSSRLVSPDRCPSAKHADSLPAWQIPSSPFSAESALRSRPRWYFSTEARQTSNPNPAISTAQRPLTQQRPGASGFIPLVPFGPPSPPPLASGSASDEPTSAGAVVALQHPSPHRQCK